MAAPQRQALSVPNLPQELAALLPQIPPGCVTTYGDLADALGSRSAARWVGEYMLNHNHPDDCPCHRVVRSNGELGLSIDDIETKACRLRADSITVNDERVDLNRYRFTDFQSNRCLARLVKFQERLPQRVSLKPFRRTPQQVAGVDLSYPSAGEALGAYVLIETVTGKVVWSTTIRQAVSFPYISGFLAYREIPVLQKLIDEVRRQKKLASILFVDGNGILHQRFAGVASHLGVRENIRTIGVGKKLLCGSVDLDGMRAEEPRPIIFKERLVGMAVKAREMSRPIFVSPGHKIDVGSSLRMVRKLFHGHRLPEPIHQADSLSRMPFPAGCGD